MFFLSHCSISFLFQGELKRSGGREVTPKSLLLKPGQTGLRPPGFSTLPAAHLATFGFVRSSSVSSVSNDRGHADARGHAERESRVTLIYVIASIPPFLYLQRAKNKRDFQPITNCVVWKTSQFCQVIESSSLICYLVSPP